MICSRCSGFGRVYQGKIEGTKAWTDCFFCDSKGIVEKDDTWKVLGEELRRIREKRGLTLRQAAFILAVDHSNLSKMERGLIKPYNVWRQHEGN